MFYYGVKYGKDANPETFWKKYFTSSKKVKLLVEKHGVESFDVEIRRTFQTPQDAKQWEDRVLRKIIHLDGCLNVSLGGDALKAHKHRSLKNKDGLSSYDLAALKGKETRLARGDYENMKPPKFKNNVTCEFCGVVTNEGNLARWHGKNCKLNPDITEEQIKSRKIKHPRKLTKEQKENLSAKSKGKVTAWDLTDGKTVKISKDEFTKTRYVGLTSKKSPFYKKRN